MKNKLLGLTLFTLLLGACNSPVQNDDSSESKQEFKSEMINAKWTVDRGTAEELKGMKNTMVNFTLLNKRLENLKAYQEYGLLLQNHIERVTSYCQLDKQSKNLLCKNLDKLKEDIKTLEGTDMEKSRAAVAELNRAFAEIDSSFNYTN